MYRYEDDEKVGISYLLSCSYVRNFTAELGIIRIQLVQLPLNMPLMPSSFDMYFKPCKDM